jgi:hypothetical protein
MDEIKHQCAAYLHELEVNFYILTAMLGLAPAGWTYLTGTDGLLPLPHAVKTCTLSAPFALSIGAALAVLGCWVYLALRQHYYAHCAWVIEEASPHLNEALPAYLRVPLLWGMKRPAPSKNTKLPFSLAMAEWRFVRTCAALGLEPSPRQSDIAGFVLSLIAGILIIPVVAIFGLLEAKSPGSTDLYAWTLWLSPIIQPILFGLAFTLPGSLAIMIARRYGRCNALLDNRTAMAYVMQQLPSSSHNGRGFPA